MESQQAAFEKFNRGTAVERSKRYTHGERNAGSTSSVLDGPLPDLYSIHHGKVVRIEDFGAFIQIPGFKKHGLVHKTQASKHFTEHISDVVAVGDHVWVKVTSLQDDKIALSMKYVSQSDGTDLDSNLVQLTGAEDKKRVHGGFVDKGPISIEDGGILRGTVCKKCGASGHLATECFSGGEKFELLAEDDDDDNYDARTKSSGKEKNKGKKERHKDRHKDKSKEKDRHMEKETSRDRRERQDSSSHRTEKRRDQSRSTVDEQDTMIAATVRMKRGTVSDLTVEDGRVHGRDLDLDLDLNPILVQSLLQGMSAVVMLAILKMVVMIETIIAVDLTPSCLTHMQKGAK
ncbi:Nucleolar protein of 40 kDa [Modicella reniformis]|uniref:Nucleolar protein of 40 kDa n=1 Tax=Modicella reniformis TaxID=1440133 RepID=A0A9P6SVE8_9FUNG|nr:Nucleolar protein of 40 kDa [Modicella reniformis]